MMKKTPTSTKDSLPNKEMNDLPRLASAVLPLCSQHPGQCGLFPLEKSLDAFAAGEGVLTLVDSLVMGCTVLIMMSTQISWQKR